MEKVFRISWDGKKGGVTTENLYKAIAGLRSAYFDEAINVKVTEIKPPNFCYAPMSVEYCECETDNRYRAPDGKLYCSDPDCRKPIKSESNEEYCECDKNLGLTYIDSEGVEKCCIKTCNKPIKPKPPIEKIKGKKVWEDNVGLSLILKEITCKINEIIERRHNG